MTKRWTWSRYGWVLDTPSLEAGTAVADGCTSYRTVTLPPEDTAQEDGAGDEDTFSRLMRLQREALGLTLDDVAFFTGLSVRTLERAEEDAGYRPQRETRARLAWFFGDAAWQPLGYHVVDLEREQEERQAALAQKAAGFIARALRAPYRRRAVGAGKALTWLVLGERVGAFLLVSSLLPPQGRLEPRDAARLLSREEERELGFPEREFGEVPQHIAGAIQRFARAAWAYAEAVLAGNLEARRLVLPLWDSLAEVTDDEVSDFLGLSRSEAREEIARHLRHDWEQGRPKVAGPLWQALGIAEEDAEWEATALPDAQAAGEEVIPLRPCLDEALPWVLAHEQELAEFLEFPLSAVVDQVQVEVRCVREEILTALRTAAKWAATLPGDPERLFHERIQRLCAGGRDGDRIVRGLGLDPETLTELVDLQRLLQEALAARAREQALWQATLGWIEQPFHGPADGNAEANRLARALLSLLPEPPIAEQALLAEAEAREVVSELGLRFLPELAAEPDRGRRFVLGALRDWMKHHRGVLLPLRAVEKERRAALFHGTLEALRGRGEQTTAGKMARALLQSLPRPVSTPGLALPTHQVQRRLTTGLPYFFPTKKTAAERYAEATRIVLAAWQAARAA